MTVTENNKLIYQTAIVIIERLRYQMNGISHKDQQPPVRGRLEAKIKAK